SRFHAQHLCHGPALSGILGKGEGPLDSFECGVPATCFGVRHSFNCQKNRQPQLRSPFLPTSYAFPKQFASLVHIVPRYFAQALENPATAYPVRKPILRANRDNPVCVRLCILIAPVEEIHKRASMTNCVNEGMRMG